ncbi:MAG TPA: cupin domain-containing protein [Acidimicrobiales bacterium]|nr:cupin domain-containing protein [Acidimicrobiales bacterium]
MSTAEVKVTEAEELDVFYKKVAAAELQPLWTQGRSLQPYEPAPATRVHRWSGESVRQLAAESGRLIGLDRGGDRRVLSLANPGLGGRPYATSTLWGAVQYLGPHESAPAHRHSQAALRFVLEGSGTWTTVNGDACDMAPGDLVLTPALTWHDHTNGGDEPMLWFDGLDMPLVNFLDAQFFELYPQNLQPVAGHNLSAAAFGAEGAGLADAARPPSDEEAFSPLFVYRWERTDRELARRLAASGSGVAELDFVSPATGRAVLATLGCHMVRLAPGAASAPTRKVGSSVYVVWSGSGRSVIGGTELTWRAGDFFCSPSWAYVEHHAEEPSDIFELSDRPALEALHLFRQETGSPQTVLERSAG